MNRFATSLNKSTIGDQLKKNTVFSVAHMQSFFAIADQGIVSLGNFVTNILLARSLPPEIYGVYALMFGVMLFLNTFHFALITYPLSVKGATANNDGLKRLTTGSIFLTVLMILPLSIGIVGATWAVGSVSLIPWILLALLLWQAQETTRKAIMARYSPSRVLWGDALSYLGQASLIWVLREKGQISLEATFGVMAVTSGIAGILQAKQLGLRFIAPFDIWGLAKRFWRLGHFMLYSNLLAMFTVQTVPWTLALMRGTAEAAVLQAMINLLGVTHPVMLSIGNLILPAAARTRLEKGVRAARNVALSYGAQGGMLLLPFLTAILVWPKVVLLLFYGPRSPYLAFEDVLRPLAFIYALIYISIIIRYILNSLEENRVDFMAQLASAVSVVISVIPLVAWGGVRGAVWAVFFYVSTRIIASLFFLQRLLSRSAHARV